MWSRATCVTASSDRPLPWPAGAPELGVVDGHEFIATLGLDTGEFLSLGLQLRIVGSLGGRREPLGFALGVGQFPLAAGSLRRCDGRPVLRLNWGVPPLTGALDFGVGSPIQSREDARQRARFWVSTALRSVSRASSPTMVGRSPELSPFGGLRDNGTPRSFRRRAAESCR